MPSCERCPKESIITLPYGPHSFCQAHFEYFFEKRVRKVMRQHQFFEEGERIAIAVSGGKDSIVALNLVKQINPRNEIIGISIDEGIDGYRNKAIDEAIKNYKSLGIEYKIMKIKEKVGSSMQEIVPRALQEGWKEHSCSFCGVFRRKYINQAAREMGADKLVTGHNLDDEVQSICMNFFQNSLERMARMGPKISRAKEKGFIPRVKPLYTSPEEEVALFAQLKNYPHYNEKCCPFSYQAKRNYYRLMVDMMEEKLPGTKNGILKSFFRLQPLLAKLDSMETWKICSKCGELSSQETCQACKFIEKIREGNALPIVE